MLPLYATVAVVCSLSYRGQLFEDHIFFRAPAILGILGVVLTSFFVLLSSQISRQKIWMSIVVAVNLSAILFLAGMFFKLIVSMVIG